jgi:hypothetical protein
MERLMALIAHAERFHPEALTLVDRRLYGGLRFFQSHKMRSEFNPGEVRLALDIIKELRPGEHLLPDEQKLLAKLDPRAFRR